MIWGMVAIFVMVALWSILGYLQKELGLNAAGALGNFVEQPGTIPTP